MKTIQPARLQDQSSNPFTPWIDPATDAYDVDVSVKDNVVTLSGMMDSWQERELCEMVAMGVRGVKEAIGLSPQYRFRRYRSRL